MKLQIIKKLLRDETHYPERYVRSIIDKILPADSTTRLSRVMEFISQVVQLLIYLGNKVVGLQSGPITKEDFNFLYNFCLKNDIKKILEFGPGESTYCFLKLKNVEILSYEYEESWLKIARKQFGRYPNVKLFKYENEETIEIDIEGRFDLGFIDSPLGTRSLSRLNTCLCASKYSNTLILHDSKRRGEKETILYFKKLGWEPTFINTRIGLCILRKR